MLENTVREISTVSVCLFVKSFWNVIAEEWPFDNSPSARDWLVNIPGIFYSSFNFILFRKNRLLLSEVKATKLRLNKNQYCENSDHSGGESRSSHARWLASDGVGTVGMMSGFSISTPALTPLPPPGGGAARCASQGDLLRGPEGELQGQS